MHSPHFVSVCNTSWFCVMTVYSGSTSKGKSFELKGGGGGGGGGEVMQSASKENNNSGIFPGKSKFKI